jgi:hypothetical protein
MSTEFLILIGWVLTPFALGAAAWIITTAKEDRP